jgi:ubiquinone/menaquinone biosynthesis C-methylase UbiE
MSAVAELDRNQSTWSKASSQRDLDRVARFTDPGERAALDLVRAEIRGKPILDIGVGTGRTIARWTTYRPWST